MTVEATGSTQSDPKYHATLTDGTTTVAFKFVDANGDDNELAFSTEPLNRLGLQMVQGNLSYASLKEPYTPETQVDWSGGRGLNHFHKDKSRFYDSNRANTWRPGQISLGPRETYGYGHRSQEFYLPGSVTWKSLTGTERFIAASVEALTTDERNSIYFWIRRVGTPSNLIVRLLSDSSGPVTATPLQEIAVNASSDTHSAYRASTISFDITGTVYSILDSASGLVNFATGDTITVHGSTSNDGTYTVKTGGVAGTIITTEAVSDEAVGDYVSIIRATGISDFLSVLHKFEFDVVEYEAATIAFVAGTTDTITDSANGLGKFVVGDTILVEGSDSNDGTYTIETVAAGTIHITGDIPAAESVGASVIIRTTQQVIDGTTYWVEIIGASTDTATNHWEVAVDAAAGNADSTTKYSPSYYANTISFVAGTTDEIRDSASGLSSFLVGDVITISGSTSNDGSYTIETVAAGVIHITGDIPLAEIAGDNVTITTTRWTTAGYDLYYRLVDNDNNHPGLGFFEYKGQHYAYTKPANGAPRLFMQGDRGVCTGAQSRIERIQDTSKSWTPDEWAGCMVKVVDGTLSTFLRPFRRIASNTATMLVLSGGRWGRVPVAGDTEYVITNSDKWTEITGHGLTTPITDVCIADKVVYIAEGNGTAMRKMNERVVTKKYTANTIAFVAGTTDTITDTAGGLDVFDAGDNITVSGSVSNNGTYTIETVAAGTIHITGDIPLAESVGATVTIIVTALNLRQVYKRRFRDDASKAYFLKAIRHPTEGLQIWKALNKSNQGGVSLCVSKTMEFTKDLQYPVLLSDCETDWTSGTALVKASLDYANHAVGDACIRLIVGAFSGTNVVMAYKDLGSGNEVDIRDKKILRFWIFSTIAWTNTSSAGLKIRFSEDATCTATSAYKEVLLPDIKASVWTLLELPYDANGAVDWVDLSKTRSVGLVTKTNVAACTVRIDSFELVPANSDINLGDNDDLITGMEAYGDPQIPWLFREGSVGYALNGVYHELPLPEMKNSPTNRNGLAHCVTSSPGPYLYWSYLTGVNRYYRNNIDSVGPNLDDGLPEDRAGSVTELFAYPGCVYESVYDGPDGYSSLLKLIGTSYHEAYRCNELGASIHDISLQVIPGFVQDKLWFSQGGDPVWIYLPSNTLREETDTNYKYTHEGSVETGWIYLSMFDASKFFNSLKTITRLVSSSRPIYVDYKTDESATWTTLGTSYTTSPSQEVSFNSTVPGTTGKRIKLRFRLYSNSVTATPYLEAWVMECLTIVVPKWSYTFQFVAADEAMNLEGDEETPVSTTSAANRAETLTNQLRTWAASPGSLTFNVIYSPMDSKTVRIAPYSLRPVRVDPDGQTEMHVGQMTLIEL